MFGILNFQYDGKRPLARTKGGGLSFADSDTELSFRAELPNTSHASDTLELVRSGVLRGASIEFHPIEERATKSANGGAVIEIVKANLVGLALCDKPAYSDSVISARAEHVRALAKDAPRSSSVRRIWI